MTATVKIDYGTLRPPHTLNVTLKNGLTGSRLIKALEREVARALKNDKEWKGWSLVRLV
jgi:hypothetical protein